MNRHIMLWAGAGILALGGTAATGVALQGHAFAAVAPNAKKAAEAARQARKALAKHKGAQAVAQAEVAVANDPQNPDYRALLGQSYLLAGRFTAAGQALTDALTLSPEDGRVALNLTLAKIAEGDWAGARTMLQSHAERIPASDRGLALALAGDPVGAVEILTQAARDPSATAKTRQNLALALALSGRWPEAKAIAATDVPPDQLQARLMQWASFAQPTNAYDQVAALLGVRAVQDPGQPVALALASQANVGVAANQPVPTPAAQPAETLLADATPAPQPTPAVEATPAPVAVASAATPAPVDFAPRREVVEQVRVRAAARPVPAKPAAVASTPSPDKPARLAAGNFFVQLGAYQNAAVARDSWRRLAQRVPALGGHAPQGAAVSTKAGSFYRLSVGGFARNDAVALCQKVRSGGGTCFVRVQAGDAVARWFKPGGAQLASR